MFFLSNTYDAKSYTLIHNAFFEKIMPYIEANYLKIYMYTYYLAMNIDKLGVKNSDDIAKELNIDKMEILSAFDYLSKCNLIRKHYIENSTSDNYSVEILPIDRYKKEIKESYEEEYLGTKNEKLRQMYDKIEEITKLHLNAYDIKKIDSTIKNNDIAYDVVVEAFKFVYYNKKKSSVQDALNTLKIWIKDGIYTSSDLDENLFNINERYATYRKILKYFGEYRLPTKPEMKKMDKWLDVYNFSIEVIEKAIDETLKIKSPNFVYLGAILDNWYKIYAKHNKDLPDKKTEFANFKKEVISLQEKTQKIGQNQEKKLLFLYRHYQKDTIYSAIKHIVSKKKTNDIDTLFDLITGGNMEESLQKETFISFGNIKMKQLQKLIEREKTEKEFKDTKKSKTKNLQEDKKSYLNTINLTEAEMEELMLSKNKFKDFTKNDEKE